jgi:hypothetical protein
MKRTFFISILTLALSGCGILVPQMVGVVYPVENPFYALADVQLVGCYGNRATATVELVFTVTSHSNIISRGTFGAFPNTKFIARGKAYIPYNSAGTTVELVRHLPSDAVISDIRGVPDYLTQFDRIELQWYFDASHHSGKAQHNLVFNNVPINWK